MALSQSLQQKLLQKLTPQQIQLMKLLQVPTANLEERIKEELEENPALEIDEDNHEEDFLDNSSEIEDNGDEDFEPDGSTDEYENIDVSEYVTDGDDEVGDYKLRNDNYSEAEEQRTMPYKVETTFHDLLIDQLGMLSLDEKNYIIAEQIVGSIDDDGYLRREIASICDDLAFRQNVITTEKEVEELVKKIQLFDPPGICARNLQECLLLQLNRLSKEGKDVHIAVNIIQNHFEEFTRKHYEKIQKSLDLSDNDLRDIINTIIKLNPKPGGNVGEINKAEAYVIPDFFIYNNNGKLELMLNSQNAPDLRISSDYRDMLKEYDKGKKKDQRQKEAVLFIKQKIDSAKWFIDMIKQRQHTLLSTMDAIMNYQKDFFLNGDETNLRPMILKDISDITGLDISTVSRVANNKFVQTEFGTYRLKYFFSEALSTTNGEDVSSREVKKILSELIDVEDKRNPLKDETLTELLKEKGYNIARRTVAKYRELLNLPVARLRKSL